MLINFLPSLCITLSTKHSAMRMGPQTLVFMTRYHTSYVYVAESLAENSLVGIAVAYVTGVVDQHIDGLPLLLGGKCVDLGVVSHLQLFDRDLRGVLLGERIEVVRFVWHATAGDNVPACVGVLLHEFQT
jgi:hypothetical protein